MKRLIQKFGIVLILVQLLGTMAVVAKNKQCDELIMISKDTVLVYDSVATFYYPNGTVSSSGPMRQGQPDGYWKSYHENGLLKSEGNRKNFLLDSLWKFYNPEGILFL